MSIITLDRVSLGYDAGPILKKLSFSVEEGDYLCIVGENGSGKSTLMKALTGCLKPLSGQIIFDGIKRLGYLPQQTVVQRDFPASVWEVVLSGRVSRMGVYPFYSASDRAAAQYSMDMMGITNLKKRCFRELSGGQQQRVLLARALCATDRVLLLDEPTAGLDPVTTKEFYDLVAHLNCDHGVAILMVSHDLTQALTYANKILHLQDTVRFFGSCDAYRESDAIKSLERRDRDA